MGHGYWMFDWLEDNHLTTQEEVVSLLPKYGVIEDLRLRAEAAATSAGAQVAAAPSILAGTGIDLTGGHTACPSPTCMRFQVDQLFKHVWHYFEKIVVRDAVTPALLQSAEIPLQHLTETIIVHSAPLLYLREIGAEHLIEFVPKTVCYEHPDAHAKDAGLEGILEKKQLLIKEICSGSQLFKVEESAGTITYRLQTAAFADNVLMKFGDNFRETPEVIKQILVERSFDEYVADLTADITAARELKMPLGTIRPLHSKLLAASSAPSIAEVVFQLDLPILNGLSPKQLIKLRQEEQESFVNFRNSLKKAVADRLKTSSETNPHELAEEIRQDVIEPSLFAIRQRLEVSKKALAKKSGVSMFLGAIGATCGLLAGLGPAGALAAGTAICLAGTSNAASKSLEESHQIELDGMYFLWKASEHAS
ncbi:MAG TPA: hypothetical protein VN025_04445 [Candidatus Dormibacteraeota bacterium]|jgi:hypothetical protein|nr:hypothetical protein [Candidatus Dormibacteraeota bacterium]